MKRRLLCVVMAVSCQSEPAPKAIPMVRDAAVAAAISGAPDAGPAVTVWVVRDGSAVPLLKADALKVPVHLRASIPVANARSVSARLVSQAGSPMPMTLAVGGSDAGSVVEVTLDDPALSGAMQLEWLERLDGSVRVLGVSSLDLVAPEPPPAVDPQPCKAPPRKKKRRR